MKRNMGMWVFAFFGMVLMSQTARAMPRVYQCKIYDYTEAGVLTTEFDYIVGSGYRSAKSSLSEVRVNFVDEILYLSLRSVNQPASYSRREDQGTPLSVSLVHVIEGYSASVRCRM